MRNRNMFALTKVNGNRIINVNKKTKLDFDLAADAGKEGFTELVKSTLEAGGKVIAVIRDNSIVGAYFFAKEGNSLVLVRDFLADTDPKTKAKIEAEVRDLIRALAADINLLSSDRISRICFRDEILREDRRSLILYIFFFIIMINLMSAGGNAVLILFFLGILLLAGRYLIRGEVF